MAHVRRKSSMRRPRRTVRRKPALTVKTRPKKVRVARKARVDRLARSVYKLKMAQFGLAQTQRQSYRSAEPDLETQFSLTSKSPVLFCNEAMAPTSTVYSTLVDTVAPNVGLYTATPIGSWVTQPFSLTQFNPDNAKYDLQRYRNLKAAAGTALPIQGTYLAKGVSYDIQIYATGFLGYIECWLVKPRRTVVRQTELERTLPFALPSFVDMCGGCNNKYSHYSQFFSMKRLWRQHINVVEPAAGSYLNTNPLHYKKVYVSMGRGKLIRAPDTPGTNPSIIDIPSRQASWLLFTSTNDNEDPGSYVRLQVQRNVYFRDSIGSK